MSGDTEKENPDIKPTQLIGDVIGDSQQDTQVRRRSPERRLEDTDTARDPSRDID